LTDDSDWTSTSSSSGIQKGLGSLFSFENVLGLSIVSDFMLRPHCSSDTEEAEQTSALALEALHSKWRLHAYMLLLGLAFALVYFSIGGPEWTSWLLARAASCSLYQSWQGQIDSLAAGLVRAAVDLYVQLDSITFDPTRLRAAIDYVQSQKIIWIGVSFERAILVSWAILFKILFLILLPIVILALAMPLALALVLAPSIEDPLIGCYRQLRNAALCVLNPTRQQLIVGLLNTAWYTQILVTPTVYALTVPYVFSLDGYIITFIVAAFLVNRLSPQPRSTLNSEWNHRFLSFLSEDIDVRCYVWPDCTTLLIEFLVILKFEVEADTDVICVIRRIRNNFTYNST
jgi:hypothetical protein